MKRTFKIDFPEGVGNVERMPAAVLDVARDEYGDETWAEAVGQAIREHLAVADAVPWGQCGVYVVLDNGLGEVTDHDRGEAWAIGITEVDK